MEKLTYLGTFNFAPPFHLLFHMFFNPLASLRYALLTLLPLKTSGKTSSLNIKKNKPNCTRQQLFFGKFSHDLKKNISLNATFEYYMFVWEESSGDRHNKVCLIFTDNFLL